ncbi:MAG: sugar phosphate isomerase/epimerase [Verrucomicrobiota bacterium]|jgi:sugar phosphate isomerase/epimerase
MKSQQVIDSRRQAIPLAAARRWMMVCGAVLFAGCASMNGQLCKGPVGLQLWSVRAQMDKDVPGTLDEVKGWGIKYVELAGNYHLTPKAFKAQLDAHGLEPISGHFAFDRWRDDPEGVLAEAETFGLKHVGCAWIPHHGKFDEATCRQAIAVFNKAGALAAQHHMVFFYHTHGYEFQPFESGTLFDLLMKETNPDQVKLEMDIFWIAHAGRDPAQMLGQFPGRWVALHLKDMKKGTPTGLLTGSSPDSNDVALGTGQLDLPAIFHAAAKAGVKWYFIEDESDVSEQQIPVTLRYLRETQ